MERKDEKLKTIDRFTQETGYDFLSNFYKSTVRFEGHLYSTVEHAYQASKTMDPKLRELIRKAPGPVEAKKLGRCLQLREDWDSVKIDIMRILIREKFENPFLGHRLLKTGDARLIMDNRFNDKFWGIYKGAGENWLGKILEEVREQMRHEMAEHGTKT